MGKTVLEREGDTGRVQMCKTIIDYLELEKMTGAEGEQLFLKDEKGALTRRDFFGKVMQTAGWLHNEGCFNEPVGVAAAHTAETLWLYLGILVSGNYYIPLQPDMKQERFEKIRTKTGVRFLLTGSETISQEWVQDADVCLVPGEKIAEIETDFTMENEFAGCRKNLPENAPMYVIFTSGSTGEPKGIVKTHRSMISFLDSYIQTFGFTESDRLASQTPFYFDASAKDIFLALKLKCQLHILDERMFVAPLRLAEYLKEEMITVIQWVPSALCMLSRFRVFDQVSLTGLKKVLFVGEVMPVNQLKIWMEALPDTEFVNLYGASELAGVCMCYPVRALPETEDCLPIGYPLPGCEVFLVRDGRVVKDPEEIGEIYVRSITIASGYLDDPKRSAEVFVEQPCEELPKAFYYKSGDLARYDEQGALVFVSRGDYQIKHMGHRIELGEIESVLMKLPQIASCCCLYEKQKIILFYEGAPERKEVTQYLKDTLASYMRPNKIIQVAQMPRNTNGKADRGALKELLK